MRRYSVPPRNPTGYVLNDDAPWIWFVEPEETTNLFTNPSWELNTAGWANTSDGSGGTPYDRITTAQFKGMYSARLTIRPTGGTYSQLLSSTNADANITLTASFYVKHSTGKVLSADSIRIVIGNVFHIPATFEFVGNGWYLASHTYTPTVSAGVGIRVMGNPGESFYIDAAQWESKAYRTTYCDGDEQGLLPLEVPPPYRWNGRPHDATSTRTAQTRSGGRLVSLHELDFELLLLSGFGMPPITNERLELSSGDGALFQETRRNERTLAIAGRFANRAPAQVSRMRDRMRRLLDAASTGLRQPIVMYVQRFECERPTTGRLLVACSYEGGLEEELSSLYDEEVTISFVMYEPFFRTEYQVSALLTSPSSLVLNELLIRSAAGEWSAASATPFGTGPGDVVAFLPDGNVAVANDMMRYSPETDSWAQTYGFNVLLVNTILPMSNGDIYVGGGFTVIGPSSVLVNNVAYWNGSVWAAMGTTGVARPVDSLATDSAGIVYVSQEGTTPSTAGGVAVNQIARWDGSAWSAMGNPGDTVSVQEILVDPDDRVYVGGGQLRQWNGSSWTLLVTTATSPLVIYITTLRYSPNGKIYASGEFLTANGVTVNNIFAWNGASVETLGTGVDGPIYDMAVDPVTRDVWVVGAFTTAGGVSTPDGIAYWNGSSWNSPGISLPAAVFGIQKVRSVSFDPYGGMYIGLNYGGTAPSATVAETTTYTFPTSTASWTRITFVASASVTVSNIKILRPRGELFLNLPILPGETLSIELSVKGVRALSNIRSSVGTTILPGSQLATALPVKGVNQISYLVNTPANVEVFAVSQPATLSLDEATL